VNGLGQDDDRNLVAAVIGIAHALSLSVITKGVETQAQAAQLITLGCRSAQGFLYGRPQHPQAFSTLLRSRNLNLATNRTT
jgi:EAL domain-containing protein (putative c-di-GMP-specific phosphodiesterase class I)